MADIVIAIDGTGLWSNTEYEAEMKNSFVSRLHRGAAAKMTSYYQRGPSLTGVESSIYGVKSFMKYLDTLIAAQPGEPINVYITGYSRGAMVAVYVANRIHTFNTLNGLYRSTTNAVRGAFGLDTSKPVPVKIRSLLLFDAVDSDITMWGPGIETVPEIVVSGAHFICRESSTWMPRSRWYFNRITLTDPNHKVQVLPFECTHACIGGLPGTGDHRVPGTSVTAVASGLAKMGNTRPGFTPQGTLASAAGNFVSGAAGDLWQQYRSNITYEQDMATFDKVERQLVRTLQAIGWPAPLAPRLV